MLSLRVVVFASLASFCFADVPFKPFDLNAVKKYRKPSDKLKDVSTAGLAEVQELCQKRSDIDYFRDPANIKFRCDVVYRCERPGKSNIEDGEPGVIRLVRIQCPSGLHFDIIRQTCDWRSRVKNCDLVARPELVKPNFKTDKPVCPEGQLQCADGVCLPKADFCNDEKDCQDGSDENACSLEEDPNVSPPCDPIKCKVPECFCVDRHDDEFVVNPFAGKLNIEQVPQMILISFNGAVNVDNFRIYEDIFNERSAINPNNCTAKGTFFVSHKFSNYSAVQELHRRGHEIATFSVSSKDDPAYWSSASWDDWFDEISGGRSILEKFADIRDSSIVGMRAPFLQIGGNKQFRMLHDAIFTYDASITVPLNKIPIWPYTLHNKISHKCTGNCPTRSFALWEVPINELDRRENVVLDEALTGCALVSSCGTLTSEKQFSHFLENNFRRHYTTSKAPMSLALDASWLTSNKGFVKVLTSWMDSLLKKYPDVYFVSHVQAIQWIQSAVGVEQLNDFAPWKSPVCRPTGLPACFLPNTCPLRTPALPNEVNRLHTCGDCPRYYPWLKDPSGEGKFVR